MSKYMYFYTNGKVVYHSTLSFDNVDSSCAIYEKNDCATYEQNEGGYYKCIAVVTIPENK